MRKTFGRRAFGALALMGFIPSAVVSVSDALMSMAQANFSGKTLNCVDFKPFQDVGATPQQRLGDGFSRVILNSQDTINTTNSILNATISGQDFPISTLSMAGANVWLMNKLSQDLGFSVQYSGISFPPNMSLSTRQIDILTYLLATPNPLTPKSDFGSPAYDCVVTAVVETPPTAVATGIINLLHPNTPFGFVVVTNNPVLINPTISTRLWTWTTPFSRNVWIVLMLSLVVKGALMYVLEARGVQPEIEEFSEVEGAYHKLLVGLYRAIISFTTLNAIGFEPKSIAGRVYHISTSIFILLMFSFYLANLSAALTIFPNPVQAINTIDDFAASKTPACILNNTAHIAFMQSFYPQIRTIVRPSAYASDVFGDVLSGQAGCQGAVVPATDALFWLSSQGDPDGDFCGLQTTGSTLGLAYATIAFSHAVPVELLNPFVLKHISSGSLYRATSVEDFPVGSGARQQCTGLPALAQQAPPLELADVAGIFVIHAIFLLMSLLIRAADGAKEVLVGTDHRRWAGVQLAGGLEDSVDSLKELARHWEGTEDHSPSKRLGVLVTAISSRQSASSPGGRNGRIPSFASALALGLLAAAAPEARAVDLVTTAAKAKAAAVAHKSFGGLHLNCVDYRLMQDPLGTPAEQYGDGFSRARFSIPYNDSTIQALLNAPPDGSVYKIPDGYMDGSNVWLLNTMAAAANFTVSYYGISLPENLSLASDPLDLANYMFGAKNFDCITTSIIETEAITESVSFMHPSVPITYAVVAETASYEPPPTVSRLFNWVRPFDSKTWILLFISLPFSGVAMYGTDVFGRHRRSREHDFWLPETLRTPNMHLAFEAFYRGVTSFTTQNAVGFRPLTHSGRLYHAGLTLPLLLLFNMFVAQLSAQMSTLPIPVQAITSIDSFAANGLTACMLNVQAHIDFMANFYPTTAVLVVNSTYTTDLFAALQDASVPCVGGVVPNTEALFWLSAIGDAGGAFCGLAKYGAEVGIGMSAVAFNPSIATGPLAPLVVSLIDDGSFFNRTSSSDFVEARSQCSAPPPLPAPAAPLSLVDIGGVFIVHGCGLVAALLIYGFSYLLHRMERKKEGSLDGNDESESGEGRNGEGSLHSAKGWSGDGGKSGASALNLSRPSGIEEVRRIRAHVRELKQIIAAIEAMSNSEEERLLLTTGEAAVATEAGATDAADVQRGEQLELENDRKE